jgi:hypothetical protein
MASSRAAKVWFGLVLWSLVWNRELNANLRGCSCRTLNQNCQNRFYKVWSEFEQVWAEPWSTLCQNWQALTTWWNTHSDGTGIFYKVIVLNIHCMFHYDSHKSTLSSYLNSWRVIGRPGVAWQMEKKTQLASTMPHTVKLNVHSLCWLTQHPQLLLQLPNLSLSVSKLTKTESSSLKRWIYGVSHNCFVSPSQRYNTPMGIRVA